MQFVLNYSPLAEKLVQAGELIIDRFKCPAWPEVIPAAGHTRPVYVHFPLIVGQSVINSEKKQAPDWGFIRALKEQTDTPYVNLHPILRAADFPHIPVNSIHSAHFQEMVARVSDQVAEVCQRFGVDQVILENVYDDGGRNLRLNYVPEFYQAVLENTGCGLLLDLAHAYLAALALQTDPQTYTAALPTGRIKEIHTTGIQKLEGEWLNIGGETGYQTYWQHLAGQYHDHLPYRDEDWGFTRWAMAHLHSGRWAKPWAVSLEYGGVGGLWEASTNEQILRTQVPYLAQLVKEGQVVELR